MGSILIAVPKTEDANRISKMIQSSGLVFEVEICSTGSEVLRVANEREFGAVICSKRLRDMNFTELEEYLPPFFGMIVLTGDASLETNSERCVKLVNPMKWSDLFATIEMITAGFHRQKKKNGQVPKKRSREEAQIIDKAKAVLIDRNGMSEPEAFRYLQKTSMDCGRSMVESAQMILAMKDFRIY